MPAPSAYVLAVRRALACYAIAITTLPAADGRAAPAEILSERWLRTAELGSRLQHHAALRAAVVVGSDVAVPSLGSRGVPAGAAPAPAKSLAAVAAVAGTAPDELVAAELALRNNTLLARDELTWDPAKLQLVATIHHSLVRAAAEHEDRGLIWFI